MTLTSDDVLLGDIAIIEKALSEEGKRPASSGGGGG